MTNQYINVPVGLLRDPNLQGTNRLLLYSYILSLTKNKKYCSASNKYLAEMLNTTNGNIRYELSKLRKLGYIKDLPTKHGRKIAALIGIDDTLLVTTNNVLVTTNNVLVTTNNKCESQLTNNRGYSNSNNNTHINGGSNYNHQGVPLSEVDRAIIKFQTAYRLNTHPNTIAEIKKQLYGRNFKDQEIISTIDKFMDGDDTGDTYCVETLLDIFDKCTHIDFAIVDLLGIAV